MFNVGTQAETSVVVSAERLCPGVVRILISVGMLLRCCTRSVPRSCLDYVVTLVLHECLNYHGQCTIKNETGR